MGELLSQLWSPEMQMALTGVVVLLVVLYVLSIVWVVRDAYMRGVTWWVWGIVALVPIRLLHAAAAHDEDRPRRAEPRGGAEETPAHALRRVRHVRLPRRGRLRAVPQLPHPAEEHVRSLQEGARAHVDRVPFLRHARERRRPPAAFEGVGRLSRGACLAEYPALGLQLVGAQRVGFGFPRRRHYRHAAFEQPQHRGAREPLLRRTKAGFRRRPLGRVASHNLYC